MTGVPMTGPEDTEVKAVRRGIHRRIRSDAVWAEARKAWEDGETARSAAKRYDVGAPALWKRREADRLWGQGRAWGSAVWDADGRMRPMPDIDGRLINLFRDDWREDQGLPEGAAPHHP